MVSLETPQPNESRGELDLDRAIKWIYLVPILLLRKLPSAMGTKACELMPIVQRRLNQYHSGDWAGLVHDYE